MIMHWAAQLAYIQERKIESEIEEKQKQCQHLNVKITGKYRQQKHTDHKDGQGYSVRFLGLIKTGECRDCGCIVDETTTGSNKYKFVPAV